MKKVAVVILNFKVKEATLNCIESVKKSSWKNLEIIVVDNNSGDGLEEAIKKVSGINFIQTGSNLGYTGGNNIGIKQAVKMGAGYVFVLNADTLIENKTVENLVKAAEDDRVGIVGPKILFPDKETVWFAGGIFDTANVLGSHRGVDEKDQGQYETLTEIDYATGGAMFVKSDVFEKIGFFDDHYFLYYEDSDFCFRARKAGFKIVYQPKAVVLHHNAQSTGLGSPLQDYFITRNRMLFAFKFLPFRTRFALLREAMSHLNMPIRRLALTDFLTGNLGKGSFFK
jgi:GT2 family glycosyltransferase